MSVFYAQPVGNRIRYNFNRYIRQKYPCRVPLNAINAIGPKIGFPARRCRCPDLRPAGPFGVTPRRLAAFDPARRAPFGMPAGAAARARFPSQDPVHGCRMRRTRRLAAALAPMPPLAAPPHAEWVCPSVWPCGPLWAARPDDPVARVRLRLGGRPACGAQESQTAGRGGQRCVRRPARQGRSGLRAQGMPQGARAGAGPAKTGEAAPARHAPRSPVTTLWPHAASSGAACSP